MEREKFLSRGGAGLFGVSFNSFSIRTGHSAVLSGV